MSRSRATPESPGLREQPRGGVGDVEREVGWQPLTQVPAGFRGAAEDAQVALARFWRDQEGDALEELVAIWRGAVEDPVFTGSPVAFRRDVWNRLGIALNWRGVRSASRTDLRAALEAWETALGIADSTWGNYAGCVSNMARNMLAAFQLFGEADLDRAVKLSEEGVAAAPADDPVLATRCRLAGAAAHASRHRVQGRSEDIERAIALSEVALQTAARWPPLIPEASAQLAENLGQRYESFNDVDDLRRAISLLDSVVDETAEARRPRLISLLGSLLRQRWFLLRHPEDLDRSIQCNEVGLATAQGTLRPIRMTNLGNALLERWNLRGRMEDLERAAELQVRAVELSDPTDWQLAARLNNAGNSTLALARETNDRTVLEQAISYYERAVAESRPDAQELPSRHYNLGRALIVATESYPDAAFHPRVGRAFRAACEGGLDRALQWALEASRAWGGWAARRGNWTEAATAYDLGVEALSRLFVAQLTRDDKETWLVQARGLQGQAVYATVLADRPRDAVLAAERARAMLLSDALGRDRADLAQVAADGRGDLVERFRAAGERWRIVAGASVQADPDGTSRG